MRKVSATVKVMDKADKEGNRNLIGSQDYEKQVFGEPKDEAPDQLLASAIGFLQKEAGSEGNGVTELLSHVTYSYDLGQRSAIRQGIIASIQGPDKAIDKAIDALVKAYTAMGKSITREDARKLMPAAAAE